MSEPVVIVGSGLAAYNCAREFRKLDSATPLTIVTRDGGGFYSKPMLSNALAGNKTPQALVMKPVEKMAEELNATILTRRSVVSIDTQRRQLQLDDGAALAYRDLVLALGADPVRLQLTGDATPEILSVNDLDDYARFAERLDGVRRVAILGAGLIGCEFANDLLARGIEPVVIDPALWPLSRLVPQQAGAWLQAKLAAAGVDFRLGLAASAVARSEAGYRLTLADGSELEAGLVLSAVGLRPRTALAGEGGLAVARGIVVDRQLRSSDAHVYALGDCAEVATLNLPFVMPIMQQARTLAAVLAGGIAELAYPAMPVVVKTPACPTVVAPVLGQSDAQWQIEATDTGLLARSVGVAGELLGLVLMGEATKQRQQFAPNLVPWLA
ncbi:NAD(P)/FAD-dependent oxidoreductase [Chitinolyticbacter albus]|uniref:NAD(P)/FAD-dependent oxidoreductase n=1 Tax=Chitinolyticbacter albus TaxID=2961951 RepID=UPI002108E503|nr:FAD-dependent oxidoreductase [Chitinolyticbacter albus]